MPTRTATICQPTDGITILLVEDNADFRLLAGASLKRHGYDIVEAVNGRDALTYLREHSLPDLIILDLMMPVMDGRQFRAEQLRDEALSGIPTLLCTCEPDVSRTAAELGVTGFICKDRGLRQFVDAVVDLCP